EVKARARLRNRINERLYCLWLPPALEMRPDIRPGIESLALADENRNLLFQGVRVGSGDADQFDTLPVALKNVLAIIEHDHAIAGVAARAPEPVGAIAAHGAGQSMLTAEEIDCASLSVVLREDAAVGALRGGNPVPGNFSFVRDL